MKFSKGQSGNPKGKPKGTLSRKSTLVIEAVRKALGKEPIEHIIELIEGLPTRSDKAEHYERLMPYMYPKLQNIEHSGGIDTGNTTGESVEKLVEVLKELK